MKIRKLLVALSFPFLLSGCKDFSSLSDYGAFLGSNTTNNFINYKYVSFDVLSFPDSEIEKLNEHKVCSFGYLNIGSLEKFHSDYNEYVDLTFKDYDNWPDERWIDVSQKSWQNHIKDTASSFKNMGANGLFLDNFDVIWAIFL